MSRQSGSSNCPHCGAERFDLRSECWLCGAPLPHDGREPAARQPKEPDGTLTENNRAAAGTRKSYDDLDLETPKALGVFFLLGLAMLIGLPPVGVLIMCVCLVLGTRHLVATAKYPEYRNQLSRSTTRALVAMSAFCTVIVAGAGLFLVACAGLLKSAAPGPVHPVFMLILLGPAAFMLGLCAIVWLQIMHYRRRRP